jgi:hypothetical protein
MSNPTTTELPDISALTADQKWQLLTMLIKDEMSRAPVPMAFVVRDEGKVLGKFLPEYTPPAKTTLPEVPEGYWEEVARLAENPGKTFTLEEILALEESGADAELLR